MNIYTELKERNVLGDYDTQHYAIGMQDLQVKNNYAGSMYFILKWGGSAVFAYICIYVFQKGQ